MKKKNIVTVVLIMSIIVSTLDTSNAKAGYYYRSLDSSQKYVEERIAEVTAANWKTYGILPSVAIAQAMTESSLGKHRVGWNMWGIKSGAVSYGSIEEGTKAYMRVVNNTQYYHNVAFQRSYYTQLRHILDGGYCYPEGDYYRASIAAIEHYGWYKYDQKLFKQLEKERKRRIARRKARRKARRLARKLARQEKRRKERQAETYFTVYDPDVPTNSIGISKKIVPQGSLYMTIDNEMHGIVYTVWHEKKYKDSIKKNIIYVSDEDLINRQVQLEVFENAVG